VTGKAQKESIEINKSLFTLRQVISALNDTKKDAYIPYRDSKLTCLLRQSLGGNSFCCMIACLHPSDRFLEENVSTLTYASKAAQIANTPIRNDDPKTKQIEELKQHVKLLTSELLRANQHIQFLSQLTGQKAEVFGDGLIGTQKASITIHNNYNSNVVAYINQKGNALPAIRSTRKEQLADIEESPIILDGAKYRPKPAPSSKNSSRSGVSGSSLGIQQSLSIAKDVFGETARLQEKLTYQSHVIETYKVEVFQMRLENEDLRTRLQYLETLTGKDSAFIRDNISEETQKIDWAQLLLDDKTDDMIIAVSREKIAHQIIKLKQEKARLEQMAMGASKTERPQPQQQGKRNHSSLGTQPHKGITAYTQKLSLLGHKPSLTP
jgi:hypothetical protein